MIVKFANSKTVETPRQIGFCRQGEGENAMINIRTRSTEKQIQAENAQYVSGMRGRDFPYVLTQEEDGVVSLVVTSSTNTVTCRGKNTLYGTRGDGGRSAPPTKKDGSFRIEQETDVIIGQFRLTVHP